MTLLTKKKVKCIKCGKSTVSIGLEPICEKCRAKKQSIGRKIINWVSTSYLVHFVMIALWTFYILAGTALYIRFDNLLGLVLFASSFLFAWECSIFRKSRRLAGKTKDNRVRRWFFFFFYSLSLLASLIFVWGILLSLAWVGLGVFHYIYVVSTINIEMDAYILLGGWCLFMIYVGVSIFNKLTNFVTSFFRRLL